MNGVDAVCENHRQFSLLHPASIYLLWKCIQPKGLHRQGVNLRRSKSLEFFLFIRLTLRACRRCFSIAKILDLMCWSSDLQSSWLLEQTQGFVGFARDTTCSFFTTLYALKLAR
jgi:hypothetical protein